MLTILGEAERFGAVLLNGAEVTEILDEDGRAAGVAFTEAESGERSRSARPNVVNATGVWADRIRPDEILTEEEIPRIAPSRGTHITLSTDDLPVGDAAFVVPAGEERTVMVLPWYGRTMIGPTDNDYDGDIDHVPPSDDDVQYLLDAVNAYLELELGAERRHRRLRRRAAADLDRRPEEVGGHLAQGRAVRDLVGDADDHRRQARPPGGGWPSGPSTGSSSATAARPSRAPTTSRSGCPPATRTWRPRRSCPRAPPSSSPSATATRRARSSTSPRPTPRLAEPILPGHPDLLAEAVIAARSEQARSVADVLLRRTRLGLVAASSCATPSPSPGWPRRWAAELGWSKKRVAGTRPRPGRRLSAVEGLDPAAATNLRG